MGRRADAVQGEGLPIVVHKDSFTRGALAYAVPEKGANEYAIKRGTQDINKIMGYKKAIFKGDQEPALGAMMDRIAALSGDQIIREESPVGESQSNGDVENAIQRIQGQYRTLRSNLEAMYEKKVEPEHPALTWMVRYASLLVFWFEKGTDGRTPYRRLKGKEFNRKLANFGECIWYLKPKSKGINKATSRWACGIYLGIREESGEYIVGTDGGVLKCRAIRARGAKRDSWNWEEFVKMKGVPWEPIPGRPNIEIKTRIVDGSEQDPVPRINVGEDNQHSQIANSNHQS